MRTLNDRVNELREKPANPLPWGLLAMVAVLAVGWQTFALAGAQLWVTHDSPQYIAPAVRIVEQHDLAHPYLQFRTPGYPLLLAGVFASFGEAGPLGLQLVQHAMIVGCALCSVVIVWTLWPSRALAIAAGLFGAVSFHLTGYANAVMAEVPYAFAVALCVCLLVRYQAVGATRLLLLASLVAGVAAIIKPIGQVMPVICLFAALARTWSRRPRQGLYVGREGRSSGIGPALAATVPAAIVLAAVMVNNYREFGQLRLTSFDSLALYNRAVGLEKLDSKNSQALASLRATFDRAKEYELIDPQIEFYDYPQGMWAVAEAYQRGHGVSASQAFDVMGRAAGDLIRENPLRIASGTISYVAGAVTRPDDAYRRLPGGVEGGSLLPIEGYAIAAAERLGQETLNRYLPLSVERRWAFPAWSAVIRKYWQVFDNGRLRFFAESCLYAQSFAVVLLGVVLGLLQRRRTGWVLMLGVIAAHVVPAAFLMGPVPRHVVMVFPLVHAFEGLAVVCCVQALGVIPAGIWYRLYGPGSSRPIQRTIL